MHGHLKNRNTRTRSVVDHTIWYGGQFSPQEEQNIFKIEREKTWPSTDRDLAQTFPATMRAFL